MMHEMFSEMDFDITQRVETICFTIETNCFLTETKSFFNNLSNGTD